MSNDIKVGDLVMVVKPQHCCGSEKALSRIFTVVGIGMAYNKCTSCGNVVKTVTAKSADGYAFFFHRLKKIPPLSELETTEDHAPIKDKLPA